MKLHRCSLFCILVLLLSLWLVPGLAAGAETDSARDMLDAYVRVLNGNQGYIQYDTDINMVCDPKASTGTETVMTEDITSWYGYMFTLPLHREAFALTDLDADGNPELLLKLSNDFGFELLRAYEGTVYGYPFVYRGMQSITTDGEIHAANGADNFGWYRIGFEEEQLQLTVLCWKDDTAADGNDFTIENSPASEEEFSLLSETLWAKPVVSFSELTDETITAAMADYISANP